MRLLFLLAAIAIAYGQPAYRFDFLIKGGHVIDAKNHLNAVRDVGIKDGRIAAVAENLPPSEALKTIYATGLYVTPGLVDIHVHVYAGTGERASYAGDLSLYPDGFTLRNGVTTVVDAGSSGWRNFEDFEDLVIKRSRTRVLAFLNIVGHGMRGGKYENRLDDMESKPAADMALTHKDVIVGIKSAHFTGPEWLPYEHAVEAGAAAGIPVMIDYGSNRTERPLYDLLTRVLRPGDIYTHCYSGLRNEQDPDTGGPSKAMIDGRKRGIIFDVGHGNGSFVWRVAFPMVRAGFLPDSMSTDLHVNSMNTAMKDLLTVMDKFLAMGMSIEDVIARTTWNPAREIHHEELGNLTVGAPADIAVLRIQSGSFGLIDNNGARMDANRRLVCELTVRNGKVLYDLNGITRERWDSLPKNYGLQGDPVWDGYSRIVRPKPATTPNH